jgi:hypothetical protein
MIGWKSGDSTVSTVFVVKVQAKYANKLTPHGLLPPMVNMDRYFNFCYVVAAINKALS